jgi:hypothetical protein
MRTRLTRSTIGQIASFVGGAGLLIGVIGVIWQGGITLYVGIPLVLGVLGIALWIILTPSEFSAFIRGRQARRGTTAVFATLLLIGITALIYIWLERAAISLDMTVAGRFTLSSETEDVLRHITRPIRITGFYTSKSLPLRELDDQFYRLYESETNGVISRQYINPDEQPAMAQRYGVTADGQDFISYVNTDGSTDLTTLALIPHDTAGDNQERDVTQAIARLLYSGTITVFFDTGLGERDPNDATAAGISGIAQGVRESGLVTYTLSLSDLAKQNEDVPPTAAAIVLTRPTSDLSDAEIALIDRYLKKGGALFLMTDVLFNDDPFLKQNGAFNNYLWTNYGLRALDAAVVDQGASGQTALDVLSAYVYPQSDIAKRIDPNKNATVFHLARPIDVNPQPPENVLNGTVITSSQASYGETNLKDLGETNTYKYDQGTDLPGPLTTVAWAYNSQTKAKIVLVGDSDYVSNSQVMTGGNGVLFTDSMSWLSGLATQISFAPQMYSVGVPLMNVSGQTLNLVAFLTVILLPGAVLVTGLAVWLRRVRR